MTTEPTNDAVRQWLRDNGCLMPVTTHRAALAEGLPFTVALAFLLQETGGGRNVYGHDVDPAGLPRPLWGVAPVTRENYEVYLHERDLGVTEAARFPGLGRRCQGVGPMQLTFWSFQDMADEEGGCWAPAANARVGFRLVRGYYDEARRLGDRRPWWYAAKRYNGKPSYADALLANHLRPLRRSWRATFG